MSYGYQIFGVSLTPPNKPAQKLSFDNANFGKGGARDYLAGHLKALLASGQGAISPRRGTYFRLDDAQGGGWALVLTASGGAYGEDREVVDTNTHATSSTITASDAVLDRMTMILMIPDFGDLGFLVSETKGRSHLTAGLYDVLKARTASKGVVMRLDRSIADAVAWDAYLNRSSVDIQSLELTQRTRSKDRTNFGDDKRVASATLSLRLNNDPTTKKRLLDRLKPSAKSGKLAAVASVVGLQNISDDDFDEQSVVYVENGQRRKLSVTQGWPAFTYPLAQQSTPSTQDVLDKSRRDVADVCRDLGVDRPPAWWPEVHDLKPL